MPYPHEHAARINNPDKYKSFRRDNGKFGAGIDAIWGITESGKAELQAIRFDSKKFTADEARKWVSDHKYTPINFESATNNNSAFTANSFETIISNIKPITRKDRMADKDYLVVPMIMAVEGVLNGSCGALMYPKEELGKTPEVWNTKPIVVYHPQINGRPVSACDPMIISSYSIGVMMNTRYEDGKLKSEAWLDEERVRKIDNRILEAIQNGKMLELSTGLFTDNESMSGNFNGKKYEGIARNYRPDHLAILPDQVGACSIKDGAGFLRINRKESYMTKEEMIAKLLTNGFGEEDKEFLAGLDEIRLEKMLGVKKETPAPAPAANVAPVAKVVTFNEFVQNAPAAEKDMLLDWKNAYETQKAELVKGITANSKNVFTAEQLSKMNLAELKGIAALAINKVESPVYFGLGNVDLTDNKETPLPTPDYSVKQ